MADMIKNALYCEIRAETRESFENTNNPGESEIYFGYENEL